MALRRTREINKTNKLINMTEAESRKNTPIYSGVLKYFPDAIKEVAKCSLQGNTQHHPEKPLHWDKDKSNDHLDCLIRHSMDAGTFDTDGIRHSSKVAWRALANLQIEIEESRRVRNPFKKYIKRINMNLVIAFTTGVLVGVILSKIYLYF